MGHVRHVRQAGAIILAIVLIAGLWHGASLPMAHAAAHDCLIAAASGDAAVGGHEHAPPAPEKSKAPLCPFANLSVPLVAAPTPLVFAVFAARLQPQPASLLLPTIADREDPPPRITF